ncbi:hypothetical protein F4780DRAFT_31473 [Xylariomycetidae sp. FL0641]|nr:hypothetical protein F4780DRAFT_31473 [Xylariomycetidae sp. FL0641]
MKLGLVGCGAALGCLLTYVPGSTRPIRHLRSYEGRIPIKIEVKLAPCRVGASASTACIDKREGLASLPGIASYCRMWLGGGRGGGLDGETLPVSEPRAGSQTIRTPTIAGTATGTITGMAKFREHCPIVQLPRNH